MVTRMCELAATVWLAGAAAQWVKEYPTPTTREEAAVTVNGVEEVWALRWRSAPKPECSEPYMAMTCPCDGFGYGESGDLELVRMRGRMVFDRLRLGASTIPRWPMEAKDSDETRREEIQRRPAVRVMQFADYDHDGQATEFALTTETLGCGHTYQMLVGVSRANPRLHVFGAAKPLSLQVKEWKALRDAKGPVEMVDWECADHGAEERTLIRLWWDERGIEGWRRHYGCGDGKLISEERL